MRESVRLLTALAGFGAALTLLACGGTTTTGGTGGGSGTGGAATSSSSSSGTAGASSSSSSASSSSGSSSSSSSSSSSASSSSSSSSSSGGACGDCQGFDCCGTTCVNLKNDIHNCGVCGKVCSGPNPFCDGGVCGQPPCTTPQLCGATDTCCGDTCCGAGKLCCKIPGPIVTDVPECADPTTEGTCPKGCLLCVCASPDTPIATPTGDRPIADLAAGDLVYSVNGDAILAVPLLRVNKVEAKNHEVIRVTLEGGAVLEISPRHPTADGRTFADLTSADRLDGHRILAVERIPYTHPFTHDILPASSTGTYFAAGALIGSTLFGPVNAAPR